MQITGHWYGVNGVWFVWNGSQADPYLIYRNKCVNSFDVENCMRDNFNEYCEEKHLDKDDDDLFSSYMRNNKDDILEYIYSSERKDVSFNEIRRLKHEYHFLKKLQSKPDDKRTLLEIILSIDTREVE